MAQFDRLVERTLEADGSRGGHAFQRLSRERVHIRRQNAEYGVRTDVDGDGISHATRGHARVRLAFDDPIDEQGRRRSAFCRRP